MKRKIKMSITMKITLWYTLFLLIMAISLMAFITTTIDKKEISRIRGELTEAVAEASGEIEFEEDGIEFEEELNYYDQGVFLQFYNAKGQNLGGRMPYKVQENPAFSDGQFQTISDTDGVSWIIYDRKYLVDDQEVWIRGAAREYVSGNYLSRSQQWIRILFPSFLVVALFGGYLITKRGFAPVREISDLAEKITEDGDLTRRLEAGNGRDEISGLTDTFNEMFDKLEEVVNSEKQFTSDVSHELRTPLAVISSQCQYALDDENYQKEAIEKIYRESGRMTSLVNRLLLLSRSDAGRLEIEKEELDLSELCDSIVTQQKELLEEEGITVTADIRPGIIAIGDEMMLIRILLNLIGNAAKYGRHPDGHIHVTLDQEKDYAVCQVTDDGPGIAPEHAEKIWHRFYRVDGARNDQHSSGLGLSMVAALTQAHDGQAFLDTTYRDGCRFVIKIPMKKS